jgi:multiple sugar transport system permease protein
MIVMALASVKKTMKTNLNPAHIIGHAVLLAGGLILMYPLIFMLLVGFMTKTEYNTTILGLFPVAKEPTLDNYLFLLFGASDAQVQQYFLNSVLRAGYNLVWALLTSFLGGYAFGRLRFKGREKLFLALLATQMLPSTVSLIPTYLEYAHWPFAGGNMVFYGGKGILDSWWVYLIGGPAINVMGCFLVKQSLEKVPYELDEAAKVDGVKTLRLIFQILFPLQLPIMAFIAITTVLGTWNDWVTPFFYTSSDSLLTLPGMISKLSSIAVGPSALPDYPFMITLGLTVTIPGLILFLFFQRYIIQGLANTGIKG